MMRARRACPNGVFVAPRFDAYQDASHAVMTIMRSYTPLVEPISLDEAFLDVSGARRLMGEGAEIAARLRAQVLDEVGLTCSVGVAPSKFLAKLASEEAKPTATPKGPVFGTGVHEVRPGDELSFLHPLDVSALWGVGPKTLAKLRNMGVSTVGDLAALPLEPLVAAVGRAHGEHLYALAHAVDDEPGDDALGLLGGLLEGGVGIDAIDVDVAVLDQAHAALVQGPVAGEGDGGDETHRDDSHGMPHRPAGEEGCQPRGGPRRPTEPHAPEGGERGEQGGEECDGGEARQRPRGRGDAEGAHRLDPRGGQ
jgi:hypothetical protein